MRLDNVGATQTVMPSAETDNSTKAQGGSIADAFSSPPSPDSQGVADAGWFLHEGIPGAGDAPDWYAKDKY
jgi:hypothetical protein